MENLVSTFAIESISKGHQQLHAWGYDITPAEDLGVASLCVALDIGELIIESTQVNTAKND